eukprot:COSAG02_NODE_575_length_20117_cov_5.801139_6_plen_85_part_00
MLGLVDTSNVALVKMLTTGVLFNAESVAKDLFAYYGVAFTEESFGSFGKYAQMSPAYVPQHTAAHPLLLLTGVIGHRSAHLCCC